jgi:hypothetical protein
MKARVLFFALCLAAAAGPAFGQQKYLKKFQRTYYDRAETHRIGLGFLIKIGRGLIPARLIGDEDVTTIKRLLKKVSKLKVYTITPDENETIAAEDITRLRQTLIDRSHLEPLLEVRDQGSHVYLLNKGKDDELGNVVMLVKDEEDMVMVHFHTRLKMDDIQDLINRSIAKSDTSRLQTM